MSFEDYAAIEAMNWSSLKNMDVSARLYRWRADHPRPDTSALSIGRALHTNVLEPTEMEKRYVIKPKGLKLSTKEGKAWKENVQNFAKDREILTYEQAEVVSRCTESIHENYAAMQLLEGTRREETIRWTIDGIACKARLDAVGPFLLIDVKTIRELERFERDAARLLYHGQFAWYLDGAIAAHVLQPDAQVYAIVVETSEPYDCAVYRVGPHVLDEGRALYSSLLDRWRECQAANIWPGQASGIQDLVLPRWAMRQPDDEEDF